jgi:hypothetical protein
MHLICHRETPRRFEPAAREVRRFVAVLRPPAQILRLQMVPPRGDDGRPVAVSWGVSMFVFMGGPFSDKPRVNFVCPLSAHGPMPAEERVMSAAA